MIAFSVVIPTYNRAHLVRCSIDSVLAQTHPAAEIIVVNDGSRDNTLDVLREYGAKIRIIDQPNGGLSAARNAGIQAARSEWIAFLDDDDEYAPERLEIAAASIDRFPDTPVHVTNTAIITPGAPDLDMFQLRGVQAGHFMQLERPLGWVLRGCFFAQCLICRRSVLISSGLFRKTFYEDMDMYVRLAAHRPWIVDSRPMLRLIRRDNTQAMSADWRSRPVERCAALARIHRESLTLPGLTPAEMRMAQQGLATYLFELGAAQSLQGDAAEARKNFSEAARTFVNRRSRWKATAARYTGRPFVRVLKSLAERRKGFVR